MRSMKLRVPKCQVRSAHNEGLRVVRVVRVGGLGSSLPGSQQKCKIEPLEWHVEVDFGTAGSLLEGHIASSRPTCYMAKFTQSRTS